MCFRRFAIVACKMLLCIGIVLVVVQPAHAQYIATLSDEDCVGLSVDMIRQGVQHEDTARIMRVMGADVRVIGKEVMKHDSIAQNLKQIFANSSKRPKVEGDRAIIRTDAKYTNSDLLDFDILYPSISVSGDSAIVECELVLWEAETGDFTKAGSHVTDRLVFWSPYEGKTELTASNDPLRWRLVACNHLFNFLANYGVMTDEADSGEVPK